MSLLFDTGDYAQRTNASFLDNHSQFSFAVWVRFTTISNPDDQYIWSHRGSTNQISLRKDDTTDKFRFSVTAGGVPVTADSAAAAVVNTTYHVAGAWKNNDASGMKLWIDGTLDDTSSTTSQTSVYDSGTSPPLLIGRRKLVSETKWTRGYIEGLFFHTAKFFTQQQVDRLAAGAWPYQSGVNTKPDVFYFFYNDLITRIPDRSGRKRHIESADITGVSTGISLGNWIEPVGTLMGGEPVTTSQGGAPNPWTLTKTVTAPASSTTLTGLTPGETYELYMSACDAAGNESGQSTIVESQATGPSGGVLHTPREVLFG